ncbi:type VI secretion system baseplate subunit TssF [Nannocystis radixulma]|uniref:Type VI secretion system baseplate subunit TssF n=1 Tax=Nannocystis radixulma TaxID=2995305 RepID=A0ABT5B595_9BACT|nr:type VI secretion system baseplate subunit TssF [Nannocystis radixulma]MDC0669267.1 type VI secretion system baseplate subunit TssF [Nannocystis radixulma]
MTVRDRHFQSELRVVTQALAGLGGDPDLDLLIEACAFLAGRVHQRIDDAALGFYRRLADLVRPQLLRLVPPAVVLEFSPEGGARPVRLPAGTEVDAPTAVGEPCRFHTVAELIVPPLRVTAVELAAAADVPELRVRLDALASGGLDVLADAGLRLFIAAAPPLGHQLALWVLHHCTGVELRVDGRAVQQLQPPAFAVAPGEADEPAGLRLLQHYWSLPQRLLFFDLRGFARAALAGAAACELVLRCPGAPDLAFRTCPDDLKVGCVPAVNLFEADAAPIRADLVNETYDLRVEGLPARHAEILDVTAVTGIPLGRGSKRRYLPVAAFLGAEGAAGCFSLARARSPVDGAFDVELRIDAADRPAREVLAARLLVTNRDLVAEVEPGRPWTLPRGPAGLVPRPVGRISPPLRPPQDEAFHCRLAAHTALELGGLLSAERLRQWLELYNFHPGDSLLGRRCADQVAAIRAVTVAPSLHVTPHGTLRCAGVLVVLDERAFSGRGDAFLFAHVLQNIFNDSTPLNTALEFTARLLPSESELRWPPQLNTRRI